MITIDGYNFEGPYSTTASIRDSAGVYVILDYRSDGKSHLLDVGESARMKTRLDNHERRPCWQRNSQGVINYAVRYIQAQSERLRLESAIRKRYEPPCGER